MNITDEDPYTTDISNPRPLLYKIFLRSGYMFYPQFLWHVWIHGRRASKRFYSGAEWAEGSCNVMRALENVGVKFEITGFRHIRSLDGPAVFVGNHMSTLETFVLPCLIQPLKPATFIVKAALIDVPVFKHILISRDPIVVGRLNPREDLKLVLEEGVKRLAAGISVVIFPQSTRSVVFNPEDFNTLGIKLALRAGAPVIPIALKTDAWGIGRFKKDFGPIDKDKKVHIAFGGPMKISGRGMQEHAQIIRFIEERLQLWEKGEG